MLNLCPCLFLDHLHYKKKKKKQRGKYFLINWDLKRKPQERNSQCCASKIQEKGKVCIEKCFYATQLRKTKRLETRRKDCHTTACL